MLKYMKKVLVLLLLLPLLSSCSQYSAIIGPTITFAETGSVIQTTSSLSSSLAMNSVKKSFLDDNESEKICPTVHSSNLNRIFFETLEQSDCFFDPMSIYR